jgi:hypothetical protein
VTSNCRLILVRCEPSGVAEGCHYEHGVLDGHADRERIVAMAIASGQAGSYDLDALAVSDRFRLFNFTRRDDYVAYLWVLRAMDRLRGMHVAQSHTDDVAEVLAELAATHDSVAEDVGNLRNRLDYLSDDGVLHRLEDASRAGSLARYRNRQSVYQFSELGHRAYMAVEGVLAARVQDANMSRLVFLTSCATYTAWPMQIAAATATRSCAALPACTGPWRRV